MVLIYINALVSKNYADLMYGATSMPYKYLNLHINYKKFITLILVILPLIINPKVSLGDDVEDKLAELCNANGVSGFEKPVRDILEQYWQKYGVNYKIDRIGNLIGKLPHSTLQFL